MKEFYEGKYLSEEEKKYFTNNFDFFQGYLLGYSYESMLFYEKYNELFGIVDNELKIKTDDYKSFEEFKNERIKRFSLLSNNKKKQIYNLQWIVLNKVNTDLKFQKFKKLVSKIEDKLEDIEKNYTIKEFLD